MGKQQSKTQDERIIIAQNGAGNNAATFDDEKETTYRRYESYLLFIITCILAAILYLLWKRCKLTYGRYMRRELQEFPMVGTRGGDPSSDSGPPPMPRVII